ncbi:MAG: S41 family peptidase [bacterium]
MSGPRKPSPSRVIVVLVTIIILAFLTVFGMAWLQKASAVSDDTYEYLELYNQVLSIVDNEYVEEVSVKKLVYGAINGMLEELDPHTAFLPKEDYQEMREDISGEFGGLGIEIGIRDKKLTVISPIEDTPAWRAGLEAGDVITHIEGEPTKGMKLHKAVQKMRGPVGTEITISVMRKEWEEPRDFTIRRELIKIRSVKDAKLMDGGIGYIRLITFTEDTSRDLHKAIENLQKESDKTMEGLILDMRNNPGGPLKQAVKVADMFVKEGKLVEVKGRQQSNTLYSHKSGTLEKDLRLLVLINHHTASAAEIVSGTLQDYGKAVLLGSPSFGKGSVQQLKNLKDGSGLKITTAYYYLPSGRIIQEKGVEPDVTVPELSPAERKELKESGKELRKHFREKDLQKLYEEDEVKDGDTAGRRLKEDTELLPDKLGDDTDDYQLQRALDLLKRPELFRQVLEKSDKVAAERRKK